MRLHGDVGQVDVVQANVRNEASVRRALDGADACVNLVSVLYESGRQKFQSLNVMGAANVAQGAKAAGVSRLVHVSALGADEAASSKYLWSKAAGEAAVRQALPQAVILRPSIVFGPGDTFFNRFAEMTKISPALPLIGGGETRFQPVYVGDVARAVSAAVTDSAVAGGTYELGGPAVYSFKELMELVLAETGRRRFLAPLPFPVASLMGKGGDVAAWLGLPPPLTSDQVEALKVDNVVGGNLPGLADLGISATTVEAVVGSYLYRHRKGGQFAEVAA
jgi:NADH dehydrogenase